MKIEYNVTLDDLLDFNMYHCTNSQTVKQSLFNQRYLTPVFFLAIPFLLNYFEGESLAFVLPPFIAMSVLWIVFYPRYFMRHIKKNVTKALSEGENKGIVGYHTLTITSEEIVETSKVRETKSRWSSVQKVISTGNNILIYTSAMGAIIIPLRAFESKEQTEEFIQMAKSYQKKATVR